MVEGVVITELGWMENLIAKMRMLEKRSKEHPHKR